MYIPPKILEEWTEKLRDPKLEGRESHRLFLDHRANFLRTRNILTDQYHYSSLGLLLRTATFRKLGRFEEDDWTDESSFYFKGDTCLRYSREGSIEGRVKLPYFGSVSPNNLRKQGFIFHDYSEYTGLMAVVHGRIGKGYLSFKDFASWLERTTGNSKLVTHTNPVLQF